ncbi:hypothetical protein B0H14DRAFT_2747681, partial [Mycena olivaceomarginata]
MPPFTFIALPIPFASAPAVPGKPPFAPPLTIPGESGEVGESTPPPLALLEGVTELELIPALEEELEFGAEAWDEEEAATTPGGAHPSTNARAELGIVICAPREELTSRTRTTLGTGGRLGQKKSAKTGGKRKEAE